MDSFTTFPSSTELDKERYGLTQAEEERYDSFFQKISHSNGKASRNSAFDFFRKSALNEQKLQDLVESVKSLQLHPSSELNRSEFIAVMHLIVCMTKRGLPELPHSFPVSLFPTLNMSPTPSAAVDETPSLLSPPSHDKRSQPFSLEDATSTSKSVDQLTNATSLTQLLHTANETQSKVYDGVSQVDASSSEILQNLQQTLYALVRSIENDFDVTIPASAKSLDNLHELSTILRDEISSIRQEVQSLQISHQMQTAVSDSVYDTPTEEGDQFESIASLSSELMQLQQQMQRLQLRKDELLQQGAKVERKSNKYVAVPSDGNNMFHALGSM